MTEVKGVLTAQNSMTLPSGWDPARILGWKLRNGRTYGEVRAMVAAALDGVNQELLAMYGDMVNITTEDSFEYANGGATTDWPDITDLDRPEAYKGSIVGHMIDLKAKGRAVGGSEKFFRDTRESIILATIQDLVQSGRNTLEKAILTRAANNTSNQLGSTGYDVPFCNASSGVTYAPPAFGGQAFATTHTHFVGYNLSTPLTFTDVLNGLAVHISEHGHPGPYIAYVSETDVATIMALGGFIQLTEQKIVVIDRGGATTGPQYFTPGSAQAAQPSGGRLFGYFQSTRGLIELRATARYTTGYVFMYKSYGINNPKNAIAIRVHPDVGFGFRIKEIPSYDTTWPIKEIDLELEYGISCGRDRTVGATGLLVAGGSFANPTVA